MKVILSRKGFDSVNGKMPSAIMPNGDVVSFPIPSGDKTTFDDLRYRDVSYKQILDSLVQKKSGCRDIPWRHCHIDPDLDKTRWKKTPHHNWKPAFGPSWNVWHYLKETVGIQKNDVFLFFGTFHFLTQKAPRGFEYAARTGDFFHDSDLHLIWGYLQVGNIILDPEEISRDYPWHPHAGENVLIVPRKTLSFAPSKPGYGLLPFSPTRVLTSEGKSKAFWKSNKVYSLENIIVAQKRKNSSSCPDCIYYSGYWQELGLKESQASERWCKRMILGV